MTGATLFPGGSFGEGRGPVIGFDCSSRESNLVDCELTFGTLNCHHGRDAGVKCQGKELSYQVSERPSIT